MRVLLFLLGLLLPAQVLAAERGNVIVAELRGGRVTYEVEGKRSDLDGAIAALRERRKVSGISPRDDIAIIVASKQLSINQVQALYSTLQAYGIPEIRVFAFDSDRAGLQELRFDMQIIPFTTDLSDLLKAIGK